MSDPSPRPNDSQPSDDSLTEELVAYLDGELDPAAAAAMATKLSLDPALRSKAESLKRTWDVLDILPKPRPSVSFASKTVSMVYPVPAGSNSATLPTPSAMNSQAPLLPSNESSIRTILFSLLIVVIGFTFGYLGRAFLKPKPDDKERDAQMLNELSLLKNARFYRNIDDLNYLRKLDSPELFAEDD